MLLSTARPEIVAVCGEHIASHFVVAHDVHYVSGSANVNIPRGKCCIVK